MTRKNKKGSTGRDHFRRREQPPEIPPSSSIENLIVIGASAGGHNALKEVLREVSQDIPAALIIMQHMPGVPSSLETGLAVSVRTLKERVALLV